MRPWCHPPVRVAWVSLSMVAAAALFASCVKPDAPVPSAAAVSFTYPPPAVLGAPDYFPISEQGQARCVVVYPAAMPDVQHTAEGLRDYLKQATGASIQCIPDTAPALEGLAQIHVGDTRVATNTPLALPDLHYGPDTFPNLNGYLVKTVDPRTLIIRGLTPRSTAFGVVGFLRRFAGVRQYWEGALGSLGEEVPRRPTLMVPQVEWRDWPYVYSRWISQATFTPGRGPLDFYRRQQTLPCNENYSVLLPPKQYAGTHPEYFPLQGDKRLVPKEDQDSGWQPCVSNPDVTRIMAEALKDRFRQHPEWVAMNAAVNDGGRDCDCAACRAMDAPKAPYARRMSDRYIKFTNRLCDEVGREFPGKHIVFLAYGAAVYPPRDVKPHRMILPVLTVSGRNAFQAWDEWMAVGPAHMGFYFHHDDLLWAILPKLDVHQSAHRLRHAFDSGRLRAVYMESYPHWPLSGPVSYVVNELLWDPRQDVDVVLAEFYKSFFGAAAQPMQRFYETLEAGYEGWLSRNGLPYRGGVDIGCAGEGYRQFSALSNDQAHRATLALGEAAAQAKGEPVIEQRVEAVRRLFRLVEPCVECYWATDQLERATVTSEAEAHALLDQVRQLFVRSREMSTYIAEVLDRTPPESYGAVFSRPGNKRPIPLYESLRTGTPGPESKAAIRTGADAVSTWLRTARGPEAAQRWWDEVITAESNPDLVAIFKTARLSAGAGELRPVYRSHFDEVGRQLATPDLDIQAGDQEIVIDRFMDSGRTNNYLGGKAMQDAGFAVYAWFPDRTPFTLALTRKDVPRHVFALTLRHMHRARLACLAPVSSGSRHYRVGFLFKRNSLPGTYSAEVRCNVGTGREIKQVTVAKLTIPDQPDTWHDIAATVELPEATRTLFVYVSVERQAPEARCWLANAFISEYVNAAPSSIPQSVSK